MEHTDSTLNYIRQATRAYHNRTGLVLPADAKNVTLGSYRAYNRATWADDGSGAQRPAREILECCFWGCLVAKELAQDPTWPKIPEPHENVGRGRIGRIEALGLASSRVKDWFEDLGLRQQELLAKYRALIQSTLGGNPVYFTGVLDKSAHPVHPQRENEKRAKTAVYYATSAAVRITSAIITGREKLQSSGQAYELGSLFFPGVTSRPGDYTLVALDVDHRPGKGNSAEDGARAVREKFGPPAFETQTPGGGLHLWYPHRLKNDPQDPQRSYLPPPANGRYEVGSIDFRGGQVPIAPPGTPRVKKQPDGSYAKAYYSAPYDVSDITQEMLQGWYKTNPFCWDTHNDWLVKTTKRSGSRKSASSGQANYALESLGDIHPSEKFRTDSGDLTLAEVIAQDPTGVRLYRDETDTTPSLTLYKPPSGSFYYLVDWSRSHRWRVNATAAPGFYRKDANDTRELPKQTLADVLARGGYSDMPVPKGLTLEKPKLPAHIGGQSYTPTPRQSPFSVTGTSTGFNKFHIPLDHARLVSRDGLTVLLARDPTGLYTEYLTVDGTKLTARRHWPKFADAYQPLPYDTQLHRLPGDLALPATALALCEAVAKELRLPDEGQTQVYLGDPLGSQKTTAATKYVQARQDATVLAVAPLKSLVGDLASRFGLESYMDPKTLQIKSPEKLTGTPRLAITMASLHKIDPKDFSRDIVIFDEIDQSLEFMVSGPCGRNSVEIARRFVQVVRSAKTVLLMTADMSEWGPKLPDLLPPEKVFDICVGEPMDRRVVTVPENVVDGILEKTLREKHEAKLQKAPDPHPGTLCVACQNTELPHHIALHIRKHYPLLSVNAISSLNSQDPDVKDSLAAEAAGKPINGQNPFFSADVVVYSPSITSGVSAHRTKVNRVLVYPSQAGITCESLLQMATRARDVHDTNIFVAMNKHTHKSYPTNEQELWKRHNNRFAYKFYQTQSQSALSPYKFAFEPDEVASQVYNNAVVFGEIRLNLRRNNFTRRLGQCSLRAGYGFIDLRHLENDENDAELAKFFRQSVRDLSKAFRSEHAVKVLQAKSLSKEEAKQLAKKGQLTETEMLELEKYSITTHSGIELDEQQEADQDLVYEYLYREGASRADARAAVGLLVDPEGHEVASLLDRSVDEYLPSNRWKNHLLRALMTGGTLAVYAGCDPGNVYELTERGNPKRLTDEARENLSAALRGGVEMNTSDLVQKSLEMELTGLSHFLRMASQITRTTSDTADAEEIAEEVKQLEAGFGAGGFDLDKVEPEVVTRLKAKLRAYLAASGFKMSVNRKTGWISILDNPPIRRAASKIEEATRDKKDRMNHVLEARACVNRAGSIKDIQDAISAMASNAA